MKSPRLWPIVFVATLATTAVGCAADYDDSSECVGCDVTPEPSQDGVEPPSPQPLGCSEACSALLFECRPEDEDIRLKGNVQACVDWCQAGGLNEAEVSCLAEADCHSSVEHCLANE